LQGSPGARRWAWTLCSNKEAETQIREAIEFHLEGMREDGTPIPQPASRVEYVDVAA